MAKFNPEAQVLWNQWTIKEFERAERIIQKHPIWRNIPKFAEKMKTITGHERDHIQIGPEECHVKIQKTYLAANGTQLHRTTDGFFRYVWNNLDEDDYVSHRGKIETGFEIEIHLINLSTNYRTISAVVTAALTVREAELWNFRIDNDYRKSRRK